MFQDTTADTARLQDDQDKIRSYRDHFHFPTHRGKPAIYLCGNSLGLQPKNVKNEIIDVLDNWSKLGVEGHFQGKNNWIGYIDKIKPGLAEIMGAKPIEIAIMNTLTVNLHLLMMSFYRPTPDKFKILIEQDAFPSDIYAVKSQLKYHGFDPETALITVRSADGSPLLDIADWQRTITDHHSSIALIIAGGINYYSGQLHPIMGITALAHQYDIPIGWDLAHAAGNVSLSLHDWDVDFAVWCHYKYLNAGPGATAGAFIHKRHHASRLPRLEGWWGNRLQTRFLMEDDFDPENGAEAWVMSTPPTLSIAPLKASIDLITQVGFNHIVKKSRRLTAYLAFLINSLADDRLKIITPLIPGSSGSQLSVQIKDANRSFHQAIIDQGVICDWREPDVIRLAPNAMYNSFTDVYEAVELIKRLLN